MLIIYYKALHSAAVDNDYSELTKFFTECQKEYVKDIMDFAEDYAKDIKKFDKNGILEMATCICYSGGSQEMK